MVELFANVSKKVKDEIKFWVDIAMLNPNPMDGAKEILAYQNTLKTEEEKDFVDFYFNMRMLQEREDEKLNESNSN